MPALPYGNFGFTVIYDGGYRIHGVVRAANRDRAVETVKKFYSTGCHDNGRSFGVQIRTCKAVTHSQIVGKDRGNFIDAIG